MAGVDGEDQGRVTRPAPLDGIRVVEAALGTSDVGCGLASNLPGALLHDLGAEVVHIRTRPRSSLDVGLELGRGWDRGKQVLEVDVDEAAAAVRRHAGDADVVVISGPERLVEHQSLGWPALADADPRLVHVRIRPSSDARGPVPDLELLVAARAGLPSQVRGHRPGPVFPDLAVGSAGAGLVAAVGALAGLVEREASGRGGWFETSLLDGVHALLPMIMGTVEHHTPATSLLWAGQGPAESLAYRCRDGEHVQLWFGAKGAYEAFLDRMGEPPTEGGYQAELTSGAMAERHLRWQAAFAEHDRAWWLDELAGHDFRCEPVWRPGEALLDDHVRAVGLAVDHDDPARGRATVVGPLLEVRPHPAATTPDRRGDARPAGRLLEGTRVLDLSAYLAGPVTARILADLGADVVKVEPPTGDVHRAMQPLFVAGQRGKRAVALDLKAPDAPGVLDRLFRWSDVVHHNSRLGLAERLGYDEASVRAANASAVYCHASGFGATGPRAPLPANDQLMQALAGIEAGQAGTGNPPTFLAWGAVDVASGWLAACGVLAGLLARRRTGAGQSVRTSLLGAALALKSHAFVADGEVVGGPVLDGDQTGYGAAYRMYECADGAWLAVAATDHGDWAALVGLTGVDVAPDPPPLRTDAHAEDPAEAALAAAFRTEPSDHWLPHLSAAGVPAEPVADLDRAAFVSRAVHDPVHRQLGRVAGFRWGDLGDVEVLASPLRSGPAPAPAVRTGVPDLGEHTDEVLGEAP